MTRPLGLRQRLTLFYVILFALLLMMRGWLFRQTLTDIMYRDAGALLTEEFAGAKRFVQVLGGEAQWVYDRTDPEESRVVQNLQRVFLLADASGKPIQISQDYKGLGIDPIELRRSVDAAQQTVNRAVVGRNGIPYLVRSGIHQGNLLLSIGRPLDGDERVVHEFTRSYYMGLPLTILAVVGLGWFMSARGLQPLNSVAEAARVVTGSNLGVRLQRRGADDELDRLIDAFNAMVDRLENSFTQMRQFTADASHELRTPLTSVRGQLEVALFTAQTPEQYREAIGTAIEEVDHLSDVVKALLHLSQAESGQVVLAREPVDLGALVDRVIEQFHLPAEDQKTELTCTVSTNVITGDRVQLQRLISNLLSNALRFTPAGGRIAVSVEAGTDGRVNLTVSDTGCGIPPEYLPNIFDRFYRAPPEGGRARDDRGLGIGLSFVSWIAKQHNATITVDSKPGVGTKFTVSFPAPARTDGPAQPVPAPQVAVN